MPPASGLDVIAPDDARIEHRSALLNGRIYSYLYASPQTSSPPRATIFLIHGWPDLSFAWRYQIPLLLALGLRVVCPDLMGFGGTDAPRVPPESLSLYGHKRAADDIALLARQLNAPKIILGGHDWGGSVVYRVALWYPDLVTHIFSVCTPYQPPTKAFVSLDETISRLPQFGYQGHLAGPEVEAAVTTEQQIRQFLNGLYGARTHDRRTLLSPEKGIMLDTLPALGKTVLLTDEEMDYYVREYSRHGLHGTLNWYRTRQVNHEDELALGGTTRIACPVLFIQATKDNVLLPSMSAGMERHIPRLTRRDVAAGHWALWQTPREVNAQLAEWFDGVVFTQAGKL